MLAACRASGAGSSAFRLRSLTEKMDYDLTLQNPSCVFQLLRKHYSRYTPEMVERITGIPKEQYPESRGLIYLHPQGWRHQESRHR